MSKVKPLYFTTSGFYEEMEDTDLLHVGGLTIEGDIIASGNQIKELGDGTDPTDAVTLQQLDAAVAGQTATQAERILNGINVSELVNISDPIYISGNDTIGRARADDDNRNWVIGVAIENQLTVGQPVQFVSQGVASGIITGATANDRYWLQKTGGIDNILPIGKTRKILCGLAKNATDLWIHIVDYGKSKVN